MLATIHTRMSVLLIGTQPAIMHNIKPVHKKAGSTHTHTMILNPTGTHVYMIHMHHQPSILAFPHYVVYCHPHSLLIN